MHASRVSVTTEKRLNPEWFARSVKANCTCIVEHFKGTSQDYLPEGMKLPCRSEAWAGKSGAVFAAPKEAAGRGHPLAVTLPLREGANSIDTSSTLEWRRIED